MTCRGHLIYPAGRGHRGVPAGLRTPTPCVELAAFCGGYDQDVINGMHAIVFSPEAEKVRAFFADVLGMSSADAGGGWLIFALPPAELAVHPAGDSHHELYLMCDDIYATLAGLRDKGVEVARDVSDQGWGLLAAIRLPDGSEFSIYEPRHPLPPRP
jgi:predicted enzyme related to lactoylglutathione lyase